VGIGQVVSTSVVPRHLCRLRCRHVGNPLAEADQARGREDHRTLADAHDVILQLPDKDLRKPQWQALVGLLLSAAATRQHHLLSILTVRLETELPRLAHAAESTAAAEASGPERQAPFAQGKGAEAKMIAAPLLSMLRS
jgi:hypothetical protein